ncbi:MAG: hypothetical protein ABWK01_07925 [Infirmifilum sp.]
MGEEWEVVDEDEEPVEEDEPVSEDEEKAEVVESDEEPVDKDETVVARPRGDPVLEYVYGFVEDPPTSMGEWRFLWMVIEYRKASESGDKKRARRWARLVLHFCPYKPELCPIFTLTVSKCPVNMLQACRPIALAIARKRLKKLRSQLR